MALFHYVDNEGFGGDIEIHEDDVDSLFARIDEVREKAKNRKFTGRPADKERPAPTFVQTRPRAAAKPAGEKTMADAAKEAGFGKACPVCDTQMEYVTVTPGATVRTGRFAGQPLPNYHECPKCQKRVWDNRG